MPVLEFIEFNQQVFAIMPRLGSTSLLCSSIMTKTCYHRWSYTTQGDFVNVAEIIRYARAFFEVSAILLRCLYTKH